MIEQLVIRKLATLVIKNNGINYNKYANFDYQKEKEIVVWVRLQRGLDKEQVIDFIKSKFNTSDLDANRLYFKAYPEGIDKEETHLLNTINDNLCYMPIYDINNILDDCCSVLTKEKDINNIPQYKVDLPSVLDNLEILMKNRNLI